MTAERPPASSEGRAKSRRCIATGRLGARQTLLRFVLDADGRLVPDLAAKLPGRGAWVAADPAALARAIERRLFQRAFAQAVTVPAGLPELIDRLLVQRLQNLLGLARRAGGAVAGFEKVRAALGESRVGVLLAASEAAPDGRRKLAAGYRGPFVDLLDSSQLSLPFGRENVIHAALADGGLAGKFLAEARRLAGLRGKLAPAGDGTGLREGST